MQPDLPWNVAGISTEAREAARSAARREGLSVGEWLTRRILAGGSEMSEPAPRTEWTSRPADSRAEARQTAQRESEVMLDHVSRSETETTEISRRIEEQLRGLSRRLDTSERNQVESSRVMSKAAVEMNIAAREQAQAFDQLGANVAHINERLDRVETRDGAEGLRDAVKALHQGMSRLADQISQTAGQSAAQISALAGNLENMAGRIGQARLEAHGAVQALEGRVAALDERLGAVEKTVQANAGSVDRALEALAKKNTSVEVEAIARLEDSVRRLENRGPDPALDRRLGGIERALAEVVARIEPEPDVHQETQRKILQRLDALEVTLRGADTRQAVPEKDKPPAVKAAPAAEPPPAATFSPPPPAAAFSPPPPAAAFCPPPQTPPFADLLDEPPPFASMPDPPAATAGFEPSSFDPAAFAPKAANAPAPPTVESYLSAARRSARAAAALETDRAGTLGSLHWNAPARPEKRGNTRPLVIGIIALIAIAVIAGVILSRQNSDGLMWSPPHHEALPVKLAPAKTVSAEAPPAVAPAVTAPAAAAPKPTITIPAPTATPPAHNPATSPPPATLHPAQPMSAPVRQEPVPVLPAAAAPRPLQPAANSLPVAPLDRLTALANAGNPRAELVVGLKYLEGDGVPANDKEAARWLQRAAEAGEPVAQYRLGTLYERGRGVAADPAKAVRWYLAAAGQGNRKAMHNLAVAYAEGTGMKKDFAEASRWFLKAATLGLSDSQFNLAVLYERGLGVPQNLVDAYKWYSIAAAQGDAESKARLSVIASQLGADERAAAQHAADTFRAAPLDARANLPPTVADLTRG